MTQPPFFQIQVVYLYFSYDISNVAQLAVMCSIFSGNLAQLVVQHPNINLEVGMSSVPGTSHLELTASLLPHCCSLLGAA